MTNYVKFCRGTVAEYKNLTSYDDDTLYFISDPDAKEGELYLGKVLIASGLNTSTKLSQLEDVLVAELSEASLLVYDVEQEKWVNKTIEEMTFAGATENAGATAGFVPPVEAGSQKLYLCSDGTWAAIESAKVEAALIITVENTEAKEHSVLLAETIAAPKSGDIVIIKDEFVEGKWSHTGYVYSGEAWEAMSGNYNAENVYFSEDLITTTAIGNIQLNNGQATIAAKGKNLKEVFDAIFVQEKNPETVEPSVEVSMSQTNVEFEVGTEYHPNYVATFTTGKYEFGPAPTGVSLASWAIEDSTGNTSTEPVGAFAAFSIDDATEYSITATATYSEGATPVTNLGNAYEEGKIAAGTATASIVTAITGYRNAFYGTLTTKDELTSQIIRGLTASNKAIKKGDTITVEVPTGAVRVVIAYDAAIGELASIKDANALNTEILSSFGTPQLIEVEGANGYAAKLYYVYVLDYAIVNNVLNHYNITI